METINLSPKSHEMHKKVSKIDYSTFLVRLVALSGYILITGSVFCLFFLVYQVKEIKPMSYDIVGLQTNQIVTLFLDHYMIPITFLVTAIIAGLFGYMLIRIAFSSTKKVIPEEDRQLIERIIETDSEEPIKRYISLSSLSGSVGIFTKIGLTGLPLATISLTLIFAILSFFDVSDGSFIDFTKLTLGAFLGSYVQKGVTQPFDIVTKKDPNKI